MENHHIIVHESVVTCLEAASARKIKLKQELKSLILKTPHLHLAAHIRGCDTLNIKKVKRLLRIKNITFLSIAELYSYGLKPGLINPWNIDFVNYNILCKNTLSNRFMATNNYKYNEGVYFPTGSLLFLKNIIYGEYGVYQ